MILENMLEIATSMLVGLEDTAARARVGLGRGASAIAPRLLMRAKMLGEIGFLREILAADVALEAFTRVVAHMTDETHLVGEARTAAQRALEGLVASMQAFVILKRALGRELATAVLA